MHDHDEVQCQVGASVDTRVLSRTTRSRICGGGGVGREEGGSVQVREGIKASRRMLGRLSEVEGGKVAFMCRGTGS